MAQKRVWVGSVGPYLYDDTDTYSIDGVVQHGLRTDGQIYVDSTPTLPEHVVRLEDLNSRVQVAAVASLADPSTELALLSGTTAGDLLIARQAGAGSDVATLYIWDTAVSGGAATPYIVAGDGGYWIAIAGRYQKVDQTWIGNLLVGGNLEVEGTLTMADFTLTGDLDVGGALDVTGALEVTEEGTFLAGLKVTDAPVDPTDVVRLSDLPSLSGYATTVSLDGRLKVVSVANIADPSTELNAIAGANRGSLILAVDTNAGSDYHTLYMWDPDVTGLEDVPFTVDGSSGRWLAIAGLYYRGIISNGSITAPLLGVGSSSSAVAGVLDIYGGTGAQVPILRLNNADDNDTNVDAWYIEANGGLNIKSTADDGDKVVGIEHDGLTVYVPATFTGSLGADDLTVGGAISATSAAEVHQLGDVTVTDQTVATGGDNKNLILAPHGTGSVEITKAIKGHVCSWLFGAASLTMNSTTYGWLTAAGLTMADELGVPVKNGSLRSISLLYQNGTPTGSPTNRIEVYSSAGDAAIFTANLDNTAGVKRYDSGVLARGTYATTELDKLCVRLYNFAGGGTSIAVTNCLCRLDWYENGD